MQFSWSELITRNSERYNRSEKSLPNKTSNSTTKRVSSQPNCRLWVLIADILVNALREPPITVSILSFLDSYWVYVPLPCHNRTCCSWGDSRDSGYRMHFHLSCSRNSMRRATYPNTSLWADYWPLSPRYKILALTMSFCRVCPELLPLILIMRIDLSRLPNTCPRTPSDSQPKDSLYKVKGLVSSSE